jgi:uncharacterized protein
MNGSTGRRSLMTSTHPQDTGEFVDRYVAVWNERDTQARRRLIEALWSAEGIEFTEENEYQGYAALETRIAAAHNEFVEKGRFLFRLANDPAAHHDTVTFTVDMAPVAGGKPEWSGVVFAALGGDGLIERDYQFGRFVS